jgi:opacity protein-like surface antigen
MLKSIFVLSIVLFCSNSFSQDDNHFTKGSWELSLSGSIGSLGSSREYTYGNYSDENSDSKFYLQLSAIPAFYIADGLSIEPEINFLFSGSVDPSLSFLASLSYTFRIKNERFAPFIRAGYGISNSLQFPIQSGFLARVSESLDVTIINAGAGLKFLITDNLSFRTELNYRRFNQSESGGSYGYTYEESYSLTSVSLLFGFSVLL